MDSLSGPENAEPPQLTRFTAFTVSIKGGPYPDNPVFSHDGWSRRARILPGLPRHCILWGVRAPTSRAFRGWWRGAPPT